MKKTLIVLTALAGSVIATESEALSAISADIKKDLTLANMQSSVGLTITETSLQGWDANGVIINDFGSMAGGDQLPDYLRPNTNVGNGGAWTLTFALTNSGDQAITLASCELDMIMFNASGVAQGGDVTRAISYTLTATRADNSVVTLYSNNSVTMKGVGSGTVGVDFDFTSAFEMTSGEKVTFALAIADGTTTNAEHAKGTFIGIKNIDINQSIPEPTTATLSLLALAGLAARRRRK